ncbi:MAG TPA: hypothetical protein PLI74_11315, partial [Candidatus Kapabacteria bacterium]|nr:hypothetical protein [Candidatus Kapabacteria bacterium]
IDKLSTSDPNIQGLQAYKENRFVVFSSGSLETAFSKELAAGVGSIGVFTKIDRFKSSAYISIGTGKDSIFSDYAKTLVRPGLRSGFGIDLRYVLHEYEPFKNGWIEFGLTGYYRVTVNDIWVIDSFISPNNTKRLTANANVSAASLGGYVRVLSEMPNKKIASITVDFMPITARFLNNDIVFDEGKQKYMRQTALNQKNDWVYWGAFMWGTETGNYLPRFDFVCTLQYDNLSVFFQGLHLTGGVLGLTGGQGAVGINYNVVLF